MLLLIMAFGVSGCAIYSTVAEQKARLSREDFSSNYRVAVTSYQMEADIVTLVGQTTFWTTLSQGEVNEALSDITKLEKLDAAMQTTASQLLPSTAEILNRSDYGATSPIMGIEIVADEAMRIAKESGYDALLFVAVQPVLTTSGSIGLGSFSVQLLGLTQLHKVLPSGEIGGTTVLLHGQDTVDCEQPPEWNTASQLKHIVDGCVEKLASHLQLTFKIRLFKR